MNDSSLIRNFKWKTATQKKPPKIRLSSETKNRSGIQYFKKRGRFIKKFLPWNLYSLLVYMNFLKQRSFSQPACLVWIGIIIIYSMQLYKSVYLQSCVKLFEMLIPSLSFMNGRWTPYRYPAKQFVNAFWTVIMSQKFKYWKFDFESNLSHEQKNRICGSTNLPIENISYIHVSQVYSDCTRHEGFHLCVYAYVYTNQI